MGIRVVAASAALALVASAGCGAPPADGPHLVLVTADTLRADHLSSAGHPRETSPNLDRFAARSWHFRDAATPIPKTGPAFASLMSGRHPRRHGVRSNFAAIPDDVALLAELAAARGYRTAAFVGNPVLNEARGHARGFETWVREPLDSTRAITDAFLAWARAPWDRPTFVWVHYLDPHGPYEPEAELVAPFLDDALARADDLRAPLDLDAPGVRGRPPSKVLGAVPRYQQIDGERRRAVYVARYDAEIRGMDAAFGEIVAFLEERGLYDASLVVFTSDHGESLGEHDEWFEHGWYAYDATLRVPLMLKLPGQRRGERVDAPVSLLDLLPTLAPRLGLDAPPGLAGDDLLALPAERPPLLVESSDRYPEKWLGLRGARWKYLVREGDGAEELYDLRADPEEVRDLAGASEQVEALRALLRDVRAAAGDATPREVGPDDPALRERLEALGYAR